VRHRLLDLPRWGESTELLSQCGFDAFIVDHEHIGADFRTLIEQLRAAQASDTAVLLRVPSHDPVYIKRARCWRGRHRRADARDRGRGVHRRRRDPLPAARQ